MGMYKYIRDAWKKPKETMPELYRERLIAWRKQDTTVRIDRPTRIDRARSLGYKAKPGFIVIRQRVPRGGHTRPMIKKGRRPKRYGQRLDLDKSYQVIAQERAQRKYVNMVVLNSYWVAQDGKHYWYEVIMVDPDHPQIAKGKMAWTGNNRDRAFKGKTSAARKSRGMRGKGKGFEKRLS
jgi:large subunit ribosomal protein L15e